MRNAGIRPNLTRTFLVCAAELGTYDEVKTQLVSRGFFADGPVAHLCASFGAGLASASVSTPVDVIKTRLMNQAGARGGHARPMAWREAAAVADAPTRTASQVFPLCSCMLTLFAYVGTCFLVLIESEKLGSRTWLMRQFFLIGI